MAKIVKQRTVRLVKSEYRFYEYRNTPKTGVMVEMRDGRPINAERAAACEAAVAAGRMVGPKLLEFHDRVVEPAILRCDCDHRVELESSWENECAHCGALYNGSGQRLSPPHLWGEETGERFA